MIGWKSVVRGSFSSLSEISNCRFTARGTSWCQILSIQTHFVKMYCVLEYLLLFLKLFARTPKAWHSHSSLLCNGRCHNARPRPTIHWQGFYHKKFQIWDKIVIAYSNVGYTIGCVFHLWTRITASYASGDAASQWQIQTVHVLQTKMLNL